MACALSVNWVLAQLLWSWAAYSIELKMADSCDTELDCTAIAIAGVTMYTGSMIIVTRHIKSDSACLICNCSSFSSRMFPRYTMITNWAVLCRVYWSLSPQKWPQNIVNWMKPSLYFLRIRWNTSSSKETQVMQMLVSMADCRPKRLPYSCESLSCWAGNFVSNVSCLSRFRKDG